jgi:uncharacterized protein YciI
MDNAEKLAEAKDLLRYARPDHVHEFDNERWRQRRKALLAAGPNPDALAQEIVLVANEACQQSGGRSLTPWDRQEPSWRDAWRAVAAFVISREKAARIEAMRAAAEYNHNGLINTRDIIALIKREDRNA